MATSFHRNRARLAALVDGLGQALMIHDRTGRGVHATPAASAMLANEPRRRYLEAAVRRVAASLVTRPRSEPAAPTGLTMEVDVGGARYTLRGSYAGAGLFESRETIVVLLERTSMGVLADGPLGTRYRLTSREIEVARVLARGLTNAELADHLGISPHTAKRHTESVLRKLGVKTRAAVAALLMGPAVAGFASPGNGNGA